MIKKLMSGRRMKREMAKKITTKTENKMQQNL
jgi:hypothetical protein